MKRACVALSFAALASLAFYSAKGESKLEMLQQIAPGVWFREGDLEKYGHSNNTIIEMKDYLIVVDANFPSGARAAMADIKKLTSKPVKYVFDTHHHGDHAYGNAVWTKAGAITLAHQNVVAEMKRYEPKRWQEAQSRPDVKELHLDTAEPPKQTFDKTFTLDDGARRVDFLYFGWAHTRGDAFVHLPKEHIVCTGDAVVNGPYNYTGDAHLGNWPSVVRGVQSLNPKIVLPGHGLPGGPEVLSGQAAFFTELRKAVETELHRGRKLEDIVEMKNGQPSSTTIKLSAAVRTWTGKSLPGQVNDMYLELTKKQPRGSM
jgi:glyoxylase-like metal-dependent hydrolase (beta-lactamase superfamily II)